MLAVAGCAGPTPAGSATPTSSVRPVTPAACIVLPRPKALGGGRLTATQLTQVVPDTLGERLTYGVGRRTLRLWAGGDATDLLEDLDLQEHRTAREDVRAWTTKLQPGLVLVVRRTAAGPGCGQLSLFGHGLTLAQAVREVARLRVRRTEGGIE